MMIRISVLILIFWFSFPSKTMCYHYQEINKNIVNNYVHRIVDITSQLVKENVTIQIQNIGKLAVSGFLYAIENKFNTHLSYIAAYTHNGRHLRIRETKIKTDKKASFKYITLNESLLPKDVIQVLVETIYTHCLVPLQNLDKQSDTQFIQFKGNHYFFSPYLTKVQKTIGIFGSHDVQTVTKKEPVTQYSNRYKYGPYFNVSGFESNAMVLHVQNRRPLLSITRLLRVIHVSHWGTIHVKDSIDLDNQRCAHVISKENKTIREQYFIKTIIPRSSTNIQSNDMKGNIISKVTYHNNFTEVLLTPRLAWMGGTTTRYNISYLLPTNEFLYFSGNEYVLNMKLIDLIFQDMCIDHAELKILLPEGASEVLFYVPFETFRLPNRINKLFLDIFGHPTISLIKTNLIDKHVVNFELLYSLETIYVVYKPVLIVLMSFLFFLLFITCYRSSSGDREKSD